MRARLTLAALLCGCGADATLLAPWSGQTFTEGDDVPIVIAAACGAEGALPVQALLDGAPIADDRFTCDRDLDRKSVV